jgi:hypothetical protein
MELITWTSFRHDGSRIEARVERDDFEEELRLARELKKDMDADITAKETEAVVRFPTPAGCSWEDIHVRVISNEAIEISARGVKKRYTFAELGFEDGRKGDIPDLQWPVLVDVLGRSAAIPTTGVQDPSKLGKLKKKVSIIRKRLCDVVGLADDPFERFVYRKGWNARFTTSDARLGEGLTTEERLRGGGKKQSDPFWPSDGDAS